EVPVGLNDGINSPASVDNPLSSFCVLYGTHRDFTKAQLDTLYHGDRDYRRQVTDDVRRLEGQGFLLPEDGRVFTDAARHRHV
ncbi:MAG TPA: alpha/beta hydrolase domain-containing protein, partial [Actinoallomurus sp.]|nr:alpha/beta hydrolase domain-containing protein [Actinoallomurus sp.]